MTLWPEGGLRILDSRLSLQMGGRRVWRVRFAWLVRLRFLWSFWGKGGGRVIDLCEVLGGLSSGKISSSLLLT